MHLHLTLYSYLIRSSTMPGNLSCLYSSAFQLFCKVAVGTAAHILPGSSCKVLGNGRRVLSFNLSPEEETIRRKGRETSGKLKRSFLPINFLGNFMSPFYRSDVSFHWPQYLKTRVAFSKFGHITFRNTFSFPCLSVHELYCIKIYI